MSAISTDVNESQREDVKEGGCFCRSVRYVINNFHSCICHCSICRAVTGAQSIAWFTIPRQNLILNNSIHTTTFRSSDHATRYFCNKCGTHLFFSVDHASDIDVTTCSLDDPGASPPTEHIFVRSKISWEHLDPSLENHDGFKEISDNQK